MLIISSIISLSFDVDTTRASITWVRLSRRRFNPVGKAFLSPPLPSDCQASHARLYGMGVAVVVVTMVAMDAAHNLPARFYCEKVVQLGSRIRLSYGKIRSGHASHGWGDLSPRATAHGKGKFPEEKRPDGNDGGSWHVWGLFAVLRPSLRPCNNSASEANRPALCMLTWHIISDQPSRFPHLGPGARFEWILPH